MPLSHNRRHLLKMRHSCTTNETEHAEITKSQSSHLLGQASNIKLGGGESLNSEQRTQGSLGTSIITCHHHSDVLSQLDASERRKLREYGLRPSSQPTVLGRLVPCVVDTFGLMGNEAMALFKHLQQVKVAHLMASLGFALAAAERQTRAQLWHPASAILLRSAWLCHHLATHGVAMQQHPRGRVGSNAGVDPCRGVHGSRPRGRQRQKTITARLQRLLDGQGPQMVEEVLRDALTIPQQTQEAEEEDDLDEEVFTNVQATQDWARPSRSGS